MEINYQLLEPYFKLKKKRNSQKQSCDMYDTLKTHIDGTFPTALVAHRRPSETIEQHNYRAQIWKAVTYPVMNQVFESLGKIRRSKDWAVIFDRKELAGFTVIPDMEKPDMYMNKDFPKFDSLTNWLFSEGLRNYGLDANGVVAVLPTNIDVNKPYLKEDNEYWKPFPFIFNSPQVIEYIEGELAILKSSEQCEYTSGEFRPRSYAGDMYYVITPEVVQLWSQINGAYDFAMTWEIKHGFAKMPVREFKGIPFKGDKNISLWRSRLHSMTPRLDEALREYSDMQIEVVMHIFSEKWEYQNLQCAKCQGQGKIMHGTKSLECDTCKGTGYPINSPFGKMIIRPANGGLGEANAPTPPAGYVQKDVEIVKIQDERIDAHLFKALQAINMQFIMQTPLNQSGTAKEVDKDELNNFVYNVAEDLVGIADFVCRFIVEWRYSFVVPSADERLKLVPKIPVPEKFDILSTNYLLAEFKLAKESNINVPILNQLQKEIAAKYFSHDEEFQESLSAVFDLDPLPALTVDEKIALQQNKFVTQEDVVMSCNIVEFVKRAEFENEEFTDLDRDKQIAILRKYAQEKIKLTSAASKITMPNDNGGNSQ